MDNNQDTKDISTAINQTIQRIPSPDEAGSALDILTLFAKAGEILPPWWSQRRDKELSRFWKGNDQLSGSLSMFQTKISSVPVEVRPVDTSIKKWVKEADILNTILRDGSDFGGTWLASMCPRMTEEWNTQDNGFFVEVIGAGKPDGAIRGLPVGYALLDSNYCTRTRNPEFPVIYHNENGKRFKLHHTRVMFASSNPSKAREMNKVGFCALSRMVQTGQHLTDIMVYEQEKLGSRPHRQMIIGESGITGQEILQAFQMANESLNNSNLSRYSRNVVIAPKDRRTTANPISISIQDLISAPDGFDKQTSITLGMFTIALALNIPPRWIWPATQAGATKADAMFQHVAGLGGGIGYLLNIYKVLLERSFNNPFGFNKFEVVFDFQDDEQDRSSAEISKTRSETREKDLSSGVIDIRTARQDAMAAGDITSEQFNRMELMDGRLPNGDPILNLFLSTQPAIQSMLSLSVGNPLNVQENAGNKEFILEQIQQRRIEAIAQAQNAGRQNQRAIAKQAIAALDAIEKLYQEQEQEQEPAIEEDEIEDTIEDETDDITNE